MSEKKSGITSFFLGANTPGGFYSLFDELHSPEEGWLLYIVKGGPGTGKSSLMKKIAAEADKRGLYTERIYCSSDPQSLDGVILPGLKVSIADGTSPHVLEPEYPGVSEVIVDLGACRDDKKLRENRETILRLTKENKGKHAECARFIAAAAAAAAEVRKLTSPALDREKLDKFIGLLCERELGVVSARGKIRRRFLSALTPEGVRVFSDTFEGLAQRSLLLRDDYGAAAPEILSRFTQNAVKRGYEVIVCPSFLSPDVLIDHVIVPELDFGIFTDGPLTKAFLSGARAVQCTRFMDKEALSFQKNRLSFAKKTGRELIREAVKKQKEAKALHDELEKYYIGAMDFAGVEETAKKLIGEILP